MSLLVVGSDARAAELAEQLRSIGQAPLTVTSTPDAADTCRAGGVDAIICDDLEAARALRADCALPTVVTTPSPPDADLVLTALRAGLQDVWCLPASDAQLAERVDAVMQALAMDLAGHAA